MRLGKPCLRLSKIDVALAIVEAIVKKMNASTDEIEAEMVRIGWPREAVKQDVGRVLCIPKFEKVHGRKRGNRSCYVWRMAEEFVRRKDRPIVRTLTSTELLLIRAPDGMLMKNALEKKNGLLGCMAVVEVDG